MQTDTVTGSKPVEASSKEEPGNDVVLNYHLDVQCIIASDGTRSCSIRDITVDDPAKAMAPEVPATYSQKNASTVVVTATPTAPVSRQIPDVKDTECNLCNALEAALKEKVGATAQSSPAPRQAPRQQPRRMTRS